MKTRAYDDFLNPVLVKELRQELRNRAFLHIFIWSQVLLAGAVMLDLLVSDQFYSSSKFFVGLMWVVLLGSLFVFFPIRAWGSFTKEEKANSLELVLLTRLTGLQTVFGKWLAGWSQCILVVISLLPYLVLQYFTDGSNIIELIAYVYLSLMASAVFLAAGVCNSALTRGKAGGVFVTIILVLGLLWLVAALGSSFSGSRSRGLSDALGLADALVILLYTPLAVFQLLLIGSARIAPLHENYAAAKRLTTLLVIAITWMLLMLDFGKQGLVIIYSMTIVGPVFFSSCFEKVHPFLPRRLRVKSLTPWLTFPGWPQGMVFSFVVMFLYALVLDSSGLIRSGSPFTAAFFLFIGAILPRALMLTSPNIFGRSFVAYAVIQTVVVIVPAIIGSAAPRSSGFAQTIPALSPLLAGVSQIISKRELLLFPTYVISFFVLLFIYSAARKEYDDVMLAVRAEEDPARSAE